MKRDDEVAFVCRCAVVAAETRAKNVILWSGAGSCVRTRVIHPTLQTMGKTKKSAPPIATIFRTLLQPTEPEPTNKSKQKRIAISIHLHSRCLLHPLRILHMTGSSDLAQRFGIVSRKNWKNQRQTRVFFRLFACENSFFSPRSSSSLFFPWLW